mmetsp:Transcript_4872/g.10047  ORF Transcript_4872/g.10047 Transcript_4872/m.10047 type:complete len:837 (-) Transcript_4872:62-2572(-)
MKTCSACKHPLFLILPFFTVSFTVIIASCDAFQLFFRMPIQSRLGSGGGSGVGHPPWNLRNHFDDDDKDDGISEVYLASMLWMLPGSNAILGPTETQDPNFASLDNAIFAARGGGTGLKQNEGSERTKPNTTLSSNHEFGSIQSKISNFARLFQKSEDGNTRESKKQAKQEELLSNTIVEGVSAPKSSLLPPEMITQISLASNLIGGKLTPEILEKTAKSINQWYWDRGYVMNSVTGATLIPNNIGQQNSRGGGHVELIVREVKFANNHIGSPVGIRFVDPRPDAQSSEDDNILSIPTQDGQQLYKITPGRTRSSKIARMMNISPGAHFQILPHRWSRLVANPGGTFGGTGGNSAIFSSIHAVRPIPTSDDTATLEIIASENKPYASIEYGVTKSLYSDQWEGEMDFKHGNAFGGGETFSLNVRKGKMQSVEMAEDPKEKSALLGSSMVENLNEGLKNGPVSWRMSIRDNCLVGSDTGYDVEVFRDYVGKTPSAKMKDPLDDGPDSESESMRNRPSTGSPQRTGATIRFRFPHPSRIRPLHTLLTPRTASASIERILPEFSDRRSTSKASRAQSIASVSMNLGPHHFGNSISGNSISTKSLWKDPMQVVSSMVSSTITVGARWDGDSKVYDSKGRTESDRSSCATPYVAGSITSQQKIPLFSFLTGGRRDVTAPLVDLAMQQVVSASTRHFPRHEAVVLGLASRVRGYKYNHYHGHYIPNEREKEKKNSLSTIKQFLCGGADSVFPPIAIANAVSGTVELRVPTQRGTIVIFGDCAMSHAQGDVSQEGIVDGPYRHSSFGIGYRKIIKGIPIKVDACFTEHGTKGMFFGIGNDFSP